MHAFKAPKGKLVRRFGINIFESPKYDAILEKRNFPPGQHGVKRKKKKLSEYGKQLIEKQKLKFCYGMSEGQFRRYFEESTRKKGATGINLMQMLERRLDNFVFRCGFASTRGQARQVVKHSHILVNGKKLNIPSYLINVDDVVSVREKEGSKTMVKQFIEENNYRQPFPWIDVDKNKATARFIRIPEREEIPTIADEQQVVELYSK